MAETAALMKQTVQPGTSQLVGNETASGIKKYLYSSDLMLQTITRAMGMDRERQRTDRATDLEHSANPPDAVSSPNCTQTRQ